MACRHDRVRVIYGEEIDAFSGPRWECLDCHEVFRSVGPTRPEVDAIKARLAAAEARAEKAVEALRFYADARNYISYSGHGDLSGGKVRADQGDRARAALSPAPTPPAPARCEARTPEASAHRPLYPTPPAPASGERCPTCGHYLSCRETKRWACDCTKRWREESGHLHETCCHHDTPPREGGKEE